MNEIPNYNALPKMLAAFHMVGSGWTSVMYEWTKRYYSRNQQRPHQYGDTYASVAQWTTIVIMLVIGWLYAFDIFILDFKGILTAYLHAKRPPNMPIYLKPIPGMDIPEGKMPYQPTLTARGTVQYKNEDAKIYNKYHFNFLCIRNQMNK